MANINNRTAIKRILLLDILIFISDLKYLKKKNSSIINIRVGAYYHERMYIRTKAKHINKKINYYLHDVLILTNKSQHLKLLGKPLLRLY
jgi:hypothetical protein